MTAPLREVPELGPLLGRFADSAPRGPSGFPIDDLRFQLLSGLYQRFGQARRALEAGDAAGAATLISNEAWLGLWREAASAATDRLLAEIDRRFEAAREESRMPPARLPQLKPSDSDRTTIRARLDAAGIPLERLEAQSAAPDLKTALLRAAMALDSSWERLGDGAAAELASWEREIATVRAWRRSAVPLWIITAVAMVLTFVLGLSLGGYLPAPGPIGVLQRWFWSLPWR